jgi:hypothetical protein
MTQLISILLLFLDISMPIQLRIILAFHGLLQEGPILEPKWRLDCFTSEKEKGLYSLMNTLYFTNVRRNVVNEEKRERRVS